MAYKKYKAERVTIDGIKFHSKAEGRYYEKLRSLVKDGKIEGLKLQVKYPVVIEDIDGCEVKICTYIADFRYTNVETGEIEVVDVKGYDTPVGKLKRKLVEALYGIKIALPK